jgi:hypothetical protein
MRARAGQDPRTRVTICGTFNAGLAAVAHAVDFFSDRGAVVLSPADPTPVEVIDGFLYVASDWHRVPDWVESRHLDATAQADFVWLIAPDGYIGVSAAVEVTHAFHHGTPVYTVDTVWEPAVKRMVRRVPSAQAALDLHDLPRPAEVEASVLIDPDAAADTGHACLTTLHTALTSRTQRPADAVRAAIHLTRSLAALTNA